MIIGVTGTRKGLSPAQQIFVERHLSGRKGEMLCHGDCVGVDAQVAAIAKHNEMIVACFPPSEPRHRAFFPSNVNMTPQTYLVRNERIVKQCDLLLAFPKSKIEEIRGSGTWHAVRCARRLRKSHIIIFPDGSVQERSY